MLNFKVDGKPKPKQSFRYSRFGSYTSKDVKDYARHIQACFYKEYPKWLPSMFHEKPLKVEIDVFMQVPKTASKKRQQAMLVHDIRPLKRPDIDNISKNILDSLNGIVYADDKQIVSLLVSKAYAEEDYIFITISEVQNGYRAYK